MESGKWSGFGIRQPLCLHVAWLPVPLMMRRAGAVTGDKTSPLTTDGWSATGTVDAFGIAGQFRNSRFDTSNAGFDS